MSELQTLLLDIQMFLLEHQNISLSIRINQYLIKCMNNNITHPVIVQPIKQELLTYDDRFKTMLCAFNLDNFIYNETLSVENNLDNICDILNQSIIITNKQKTKTFYTNDKYENKINIVINKNEYVVPVIKNIDIDDSKPLKTIVYNDELSKLLWDLNGAGYTYTEDLSVSDNLNNLCENMQKSLIIYDKRDNTVLYEHSKYENINIIHNNGCFKIERNRVHYEVSNYVGVNDTCYNKEEFMQCAKLLNLNVDENMNTYSCTNLTKLFINNVFRSVDICKMDELESKINDTSLIRGGLSYIKDNNMMLNKAYLYDIKSQHISVFLDKNLLLPLDNPVLNYIENFDNIDLKLPSYFAINIDQSTESPYFKNNKCTKHKTYFYSNYGVQRLRDCNVSFSLVKNISCNYYKYNKYISSYELFKDIKIVYKYRNEYPILKMLSRKLFGILTMSKNTVHSNIKLGSLQSSISLSENSFQNDSAKFKMIFLDYSHLMLNNIIKNEIGNDAIIYRIKTDSFLISKQIETYESPSYGHLVLEQKYKNLIYPNVNSSFKNDILKLNEDAVIYDYDQKTEKFIKCKYELENGVHVKVIQGKE